MSMNTAGLPSTTTTSIDTLKAFQHHYSWRAVLGKIPRAAESVRSDNVTPSSAHLVDGCRTMPSLQLRRRGPAGGLQLDISPIHCLASNSVEHMIAGGADTQAPTVYPGCSPVCETATSLACIPVSDLPSGLYKPSGNPARDSNFFKSMAKTIKANRRRASIADADVVDEEACTHYTGSYSPSSSGEKSSYENWIVGDALRVRIELKFRLLREKNACA